jgi:hypothetical protein
MITRRLLATSALFLPLLAAAQANWPEKPMRVVLPYPPGGPSDIVMRAAGEKMQATLKHGLVIDNKPGAGGNLGTAEVSRAAPDGYTWLVALDTTFTVNPHVYKSLGFKAEDLVPVTMLSQFGQTLVCHPSVGVKTVAELVAKAKAEKMSYASGGPGVPGHLTMELLQYERALHHGRPAALGPPVLRRPPLPAHAPHRRAGRARRALLAGLREQRRVRAQPHELLHRPLPHQPRRHLEPRAAGRSASARWASTSAPTPAAGTRPVAGRQDACDARRRRPEAAGDRGRERARPAADPRRLPRDRPPRRPPRDARHRRLLAAGCARRATTARRPGPTT